jgi:hypothetical protein
MPGAVPLAAGVPAAGADNEEPERSADYKLLIKPWGTVYVDKQELGISPPLKRLLLSPGRHTIRIANPSFPDQIFTIDADISRPGRIEHDFNEAQR